MKRMPIILLLLTLSISCFAQSINLFNVDTTSFPKMKAKFIAFDQNGVPVKPQLSDLKLTENGIERKITGINCPTPKPPKAISSVLVIDVSGSMSTMRGTSSNMQIAKTGANAWINTLPLGLSECAITSFDQDNYLNQDYSTDKNLLLNAIQPLYPKGGTDYDAGLLNPMYGGLQLSKKGKNQKVIVFLTDGQGGGNETAIINEAQYQNCQIFCVVIGMPAPKILQNIASQTGGLYFDNITTNQQAEEAYKKILYFAQNGSTCDIEWESEMFCQQNLIKVELNWLNFVSSNSYITPINSIAKIVVSPNYISFGSVMPISAKDTTITLTAINSDFIVDSISKITNGNSFSIVNTTFPLIIPKNTSKSITLRFNQIDSTMNYTAFEVTSNLCSAFFSANGGLRNKKLSNPSLKLIIPNGNEEFVIGSDTLIKWTGVSPTDTVTLEYTIDSGKTWRTITNSASGLSYNWNNIPKPTSRKCLVRVKQEDKNNLDSVITLIGHTNTVFGVAFSPDGNFVVTGGLDNKANLWNSKNGIYIKSLIGHQSGVSGVSFSPDGTKIITGSYDNTAKIWDVTTGNVIHTLIGHTIALNGVSFSPDGAKVITASEDRTAKLWDVTTGNLILTFTGHSNYVEGVAFSPDGKYLITGSTDGTAKLWDVNSGNMIRTFKGHLDRILYVAYSPDGTRILTGSYDNTAKIWDVNSGIELLTLKGHTNAIVGVAFSPDGSKVLTGSEDFTAKLWDSYNGNNLKTLIGHKNWVFGVAFSPDGLRAVTGSVDRIPRIWELEPINSIIQSDISDTLFSIIAPSPLGKDIDMKECFVGAAKDSTILEFIYNNGNYKYRVDSIYFSGIDAKSFKMVSGLPKYEVLSNSFQFAEIEFTPNRVGLHSAKINIITQFDTLQYNIIGMGVLNKSKLKVVLSADTSSTYTGKENKVKLSLTSMTDLISNGIIAVSLELFFNKTMLYPKFNPNRKVEADSLVLFLDSLPLVSNTNNLLSTLKFVATLGNAEETSLSIRNVKFIGGEADVTVINGNFKLLGVCKEGSERFLIGNKSKTMLLSIAPNPATESIEIEYSNADEGEAVIIITNLLGQTILTQQLAKTQTGKTKLDLSQLPSGQFSIIFKTETALEYRVIHVIK